MSIDYTVVQDDLHEDVDVQRTLVVPVLVEILARQVILRARQTHHETDLCTQRERALTLKPQFSVPTVWFRISYLHLEYRHGISVARIGVQDTKT